MPRHAFFTEPGPGKHLLTTEPGPGGQHSFYVVGTFLRLARQSLESVIVGASKARLARQSVESVIAGTSQARLARQSVESVIAGTSQARLARQSIEVVITNAVVGTSFSDNYNRADAATLGPAYAYQIGFSIVSGTALVASSGFGVAVFDAGAPDVTITTTLGQINPGGGSGAGIYLRYTDANNYTRLTHRGPPQYQRYVAGSIAAQVNLTGLGTPVTGDTMTVVASGTSFIVKKNGTTTDTFTDAGNTSTATKHGIYAGPSAFGPDSFDDLSITP